MGLKAFHSANATLIGIEPHPMLRIRQYVNVNKITVFEQLYELAA